MSPSFYTESFLKWHDTLSDHLYGTKVIPQDAVADEDFKVPEKTFASVSGLSLRPSLLPSTTIWFECWMEELVPSFTWQDNCGEHSSSSSITTARRKHEPLSQLLPSSSLGLPGPPPASPGEAEILRLGGLLQGVAHILIYTGWSRLSSTPPPHHLDHWEIRQRQHWDNILIIWMNFQDRSHTMLSWTSALTASRDLRSENVDFYLAVVEQERP